MKSLNFLPLFITDDIRADVQDNLPKSEKVLKSLLTKNCHGASMTDWVDYPVNDGEKAVNQIADLISEIEVSYDLVVVCGIGGSSLGAKAVDHALRPSLNQYLQKPSYSQPGLIFVGEILTEEYFSSLAKALADSSPIFVIISKSGTTLEPAIGFRYLYSYCQHRYGDAACKQRILTVTDEKKGALRRITSELGLKSQVISDGIGGRFSVLSPVGLLPLALAKHNIKELMQGAFDMASYVKESVNDIGKNLHLLYALYRHALEKKGYSAELLVYHDGRVNELVEWWKQLFGESEGKNKKGLFPAGAQYSRDLHSLGQFVQDGKPILFETFLTLSSTSIQPHLASHQRTGVAKTSSLRADGLDFVEGLYLDDINKQILKATQLAHAESGVPILEIQLPYLDAFHIGSLIYFFEVACAVGALMKDLNPFDQPGVEAYKINMLALLGKPEYQDLGAQLRKKLKEMGS